jgi:predicted enzyme related to lactoylglutathione lyase
MYLETVVFDAVDPRATGHGYETALGGEQLTDSPEGYETRLGFDGGVDLDLCFQPVAEAKSEARRLHLVTEDVDDTDRSMPHGATERLVALRLESADPDRDTAFWGWLTGWQVAAPHTLRHPSRSGPRLEIVRERSPKEGKNREHLDVRLEAGDDADAYAAGILERGGRLLETEWGDLPWRTYLDPSGNEFCVLPARS